MLTSADAQIREVRRTTKEQRRGDGAPGVHVMRRFKKRIQGDYPPGSAQ